MMRLWRGNQRRSGAATPAHSGWDRVRYGSGVATQVEGLTALRAQSSEGPFIAARATRP